MPLLLWSTNNHVDVHNDYDSFHNAEEIIFHERIATSLRSFGANLISHLCFVFPLYIVVYILALSKLVNDQITVELYQIVTLVTKAFYVYLCYAEHAKIQLMNSLQSAMLLKMIDTSNKFINYVAHEIRNPLSNIIISNELLLTLAENTPFQSYSDREVFTESVLSIQQASLLLKSTVDDTLMLQRMKLGSLKLNTSEKIQWGSSL